MASWGRAVPAGDQDERASYREPDVDLTFEVSPTLPRDSRQPVLARFGVSVPAAGRRTSPSPGSCYDNQ